MKKYILIQNDGEIETNSFELIGASTKRGEAGKIGFFGSGLKYSIAYMMRQEIDFKVFSGELEIKFTTIPETIKEQQFDRICINGKPTSYTVTMGPTWKEDWYVLREIYCNALDESNCQFVRETEIVQPLEGKTRIYIEVTSKLQMVINEWDKYFSFDREPVFVMDNCYTSFLANEESGVNGRQRITVFNKTEGILYRKGIRVYNNKRLCYDYQFEFMNINEDRTAKSTSAMSYCCASLFARFPNEEYVRNILRSAADEQPCDEFFDISHTRPDDGFSKEWIRFSQENILVIKEICGKYADDLNRSAKEHFLIPAYFARELKKQVPEVQILGMGRTIGDVGMSDIEKTPKMEFLLKEVQKSLTEMGYIVPYEISVAEFDDEATLGQADLKDKRIYLADKVFDMGRRKIALTLIEETEHIASQDEDETREFQNHLISQWLKTMENQNGLFL